MNDHPVVRPAGVRALVTSLRIPEPFALPAFVSEVGDLIGRPIKTRPYPRRLVEAFRRNGEPLPYGLMLDTEKGVVIFYRADTGPAHRQHVVLHELGHALCRHVTDPIDDQDVDDPEVLGAALRRSRYDNKQERAAELVAYLVQQRVGPLKMPSSGPARRENDAAARFGSLLEG